MSLISSPGEFPDYWDWLWYPGLLPVFCPSPFPSPSISILVLFSHSSSPAIEFHSCFHFMTDVFAPIGRPFTYTLFGEFPGSGLALVLDVVVPETSIQKVLTKAYNRWFSWSVGPSSDVL